MADVFTTAKRSEVMSCVRSIGNRSTELKMVALLRLFHLNGWRRRVALVGRPDFVWPRQRIVLFVDGCFWHGCPKHAEIPASNHAYWSLKLARNKARDRAVSRALRASGWTVIRVWECALTNAQNARTAARITRALKRTSKEILLS
jgi:DNA mismatch endonuclease (patch repair protein)